MNRYFRALLLLLTFSVGCTSSAEREYSLPDDDLVTLMRGQKTFALNEVRNLPAGAPDPGIRKVLAEILTSAGLKEDPASPFKVSLEWQGEALSTEYNSRDRRVQGRRYTAARINGFLTLEIDSAFHEEEFQFATRTPLFTMFKDEDHLSKEFEAPFEEPVWLCPNGPILSLLRIVTTAYGDTPALRAMAHQDNRMRFYGATVAGDLKLESARPALERMIQGTTSYSSAFLIKSPYETMNPEKAASAALGKLPFAESTRAILFRLASRDSESNLGMDPLLEWKSPDIMPDIIQLLVSSRYFPYYDTGRALPLAEKICDTRCKPALQKFRKRCEKELQQVNTQEPGKPIEIKDPNDPNRKISMTKSEAFAYYIASIDRTLERIEPRPTR